MEGEGEKNMADYKKIHIDITENGYIVTVGEPSNDSGQQFVFQKIKQLRTWLSENLSATGEVERFSEALDDTGENKNLEKHSFVGYNVPISPNPPITVSMNISSITQ